MSSGFTEIKLPPFQGSMSSYLAYVEEQCRTDINREALAKHFLPNTANKGTRFAGKHKLDGNLVDAVLSFSTFEWTVGEVTGTGFIALCAFLTGLSKPESAAELAKLRCLLLLPAKQTIDPDDEEQRAPLGASGFASGTPGATQKIGKSQLDEPKQASEEVEPPDWSKAETFGEAPLMFDEEPQLPVLSPDFLPPWVADYANAVAAETQTPVAMSVMMALSALSTCIQKRFEVSPYGDGHRESLSIWTISVMEPGNKKSGVVRAMTCPLSDWEASESKRLASKVSETETAIEVAAARIEKLRKDAAKVSDAEKRKEIEGQINEIKTACPAKVSLPRLFYTDITPEALRNSLAENDERGAILSDEGGLFEILAGLYTDGRTNLDVFLSGYSGGALRVKRGGLEVILNRIAVAIGLTVQPCVIEEMAKKDRQKFRGKGLLGRYLYAVPDSPIGHRNVRERKSIPSATKAEYVGGIKQLLSLAANYGDSGSEEPQILTLSSDAYEKFKDFEQWIEDRQGKGRAFESIQDWTSKLPGNCARIAALCHIAAHVDTMPQHSGSPVLEFASLQITKVTMASVVEFCKSLIPHAQATFNQIGVDPVMKDAKYCLDWIRGNAPRYDETGATSFKQNDMHGASRFKNGPVDRVLKALKILQERRVVSERCSLPTRKPTYIYYVNPAVLRHGE